MGKVTLKEIAQEAGVSLTTVHRVLNGKEGCSAELKKKILQIAADQGYSVNLSASSLRKSAIYIALVFPKHLDSSRYFLQRILDGYLNARSEAAQHNIIFQEYYYGYDTPDMAQCLKKIYQERPVRYDAVLLYGVHTWDNVTLSLVNRIVGSRTVVIALERAIPQVEDICCIEVNDTLAGSLAAEMIGKFIHSSGTVLCLEQLVPIGDRNGETFTDTLRRQRPDLTVTPVRLELLEDQGQTIAHLLHDTPNIVGVYATSARHTAALLRILKDHPKPEAVIGSELFEESYQALQDCRIDAVIHKRPEKIGFHALHLAVQHLVRNQPLPERYQITPRIILRANSDTYFYKEKEI